VFAGKTDLAVRGYDFLAERTELLITDFNLLTASFANPTFFSATAKAINGKKNIKRVTPDVFEIDKDFCPQGWHFCCC